MKNVLKILSVLTVLFISACSKDNIPDGQGAVNVRITDGPFPFEFVSEANVGLAKVELKNEAGEFVTVFEGSSKYNMVELTNGVSADVEKTNIPAGVYTESRITLNQASVLLSNGNSFNLSADATAGSYTTPIEPAFTVEEGETSNVLFDLDLNSSFSFFGFGGLPFFDWITSMSSISTCSFEPEFRVCDLDKTGSLSGVVTVNGTQSENVQLSIIVEGKQISTQSEANGSFAFIGVSPGVYTVSATNSNGDSAQVGNLTVTESNTTKCSVNIN